MIGSHSAEGRVQTRWMDGVTIEHAFVVKSKWSKRKESN